MAKHEKEIAQSPWQQVVECVKQNHEQLQFFHLMLWKSETESGTIEKREKIQKIWFSLNSEECPSHRTIPGSWWWGWSGTPSDSADPSAAEMSENQNYVQISHELKLDDTHSNPLTSRTVSWHPHLRPIFIRWSAGSTNLQYLFNIWAWKVTKYKTSAKKLCQMATSTVHNLYQEWTHIPGSA